MEHPRQPRRVLGPADRERELDRVLDLVALERER
jgi:hypothetical protein